MNLFDFLENYFFNNFFDMERLHGIEIIVKDTVIRADDFLYFLFSLFSFLLGAWLVLWLPVKGICWLARGCKGVKRSK